MPRIPTALAAAAYTFAAGVVAFLFLTFVFTVLAWLV
jgi:hypothetical protein